MSDWYTQIGPQGQLTVWLGASLLLYVLTSQLAWQYRRPNRPDPLGRWIDRMRDWWGTRLLVEVGRLTYFLGLPFLAAQSGLLGNDLLGLIGTDWGSDKNALGFLWSDWVEGLGLAVAVGMATGGLLAFAHWATGRAELVTFDLQEPDSLPTPLGQRMLAALYDQVHWAFYRCGPLLWFDELYYGVLAGLLIALVELGLNPAIHYRLEDGRIWSRLSLAWVSAFLFLATQNFWLGLIVHLGLQIPLGGLGKQQVSAENL